MDSRIVNGLFNLLQVFSCRKKFIPSTKHTDSLEFVFYLPMKKVGNEGYVWSCDFFKLVCHPPQFAGPIDVNNKFF